MEQIVCDIFTDLGIELTVMQTMVPPEFSLKTEKFLEKYNWKYIDFDFYVTTKPRTIVDVNGMGDKFAYWIKEQVVKIEGISYFVITEDEDRNIPKNPYSRSRKPPSLKYWTYSSSVIGHLSKSIK